MIFQRHIIVNILPYLFAISFLVTGIVWLSQALKLLYLIDKGVGLYSFLYIALLIIPSLLFMILPFVTVCAVIYAYVHLDDEKNFLILKVAGMDNLSLSKPALIVATFITIFAYYLSAALMPSSYIKLKSSLNFIKNHYASSLVSAKTFNQISKSFNLYIDKKLPNGEMHGIVLFDNRDLEHPAILFARSGKFFTFDNENPIFQLYEGSRQAYDANGNITILNFESLGLEISNNQKRLVGREISYDRDVNEYYLPELFNPDSRLTSQRQLRLKIEGQQRLVWPLYNFVLPFIALAVFFRQPYNKKSHIRHIVAPTFTIVLVTYLHFSLQNFAVSNPLFEFGCYINLIGGIIFGLLLYLKKTI